MSYRLIVPKRERKRVRRIPRKDYEAIMDAVEGLAENPRPRGCKPMTDRDGYRLRVGNFRVLYSVDDKAREVRVFRIGDRKDVYD